MIEKTLEIGRLVLHSGETLDNVKQHATIYGDVVSADEIVLVTHALSGNSRAADWWASLIGPGRLFDPAAQCIIGINALGGCYGSTGPQNAGFPAITVGDMVNAQARALNDLGINHVDVVIGGSLGGMQALEWSLAFPKRVGHAVIIGAYDHFSAQGIAFNALAREAIANDPQRGLALARKIAMLTYKSDALLERRHGNRPDRSGMASFDVEGYLQYQGSIFARRMDAHSYLALTEAMDCFDVRDRQTGTPHPKLTFVGISSDWLFRPDRIREAAMRFAQRGIDARYLEILSDGGHDAFLTEGAQLTALLSARLAVSPTISAGAVP